MVDDHRVAIAAVPSGKNHHTRLCCINDTAIVPRQSPGPSGSARNPGWDASASQSHWSLRRWTGRENCPVPRKTMPERMPIFCWIRLPTAWESWASWDSAASRAWRSLFSRVIVTFWVWAWASKSSFWACNCWVSRAISFFLLLHAIALLGEAIAGRAEVGNFLAIAGIQSLELPPPIQKLVHILALQQHGPAPVVLLPL